MDFETYIDLLLPIRVAYDNGEPYAEIDAPPEVQKWIADRIGVVGLTSLDAEARHYVEQEGRANAAEAAEMRAAYAIEREMEIAGWRGIRT